MSSAGVDKRRLRIALLVDRFGRKFGGAEAYGLELFDILSQRHDVTVIAHEFDHQLPVREIRIQSSGQWPSWVRICHYAWQAHQHAKSGFDIVHSHMNAGFGNVQVAHVVPVRYRKLVGKPWHHKLMKWLAPSTAAYLLLERASFAQRPAHRVVAVSPMIRQQLIDCGVRQPHIPVIPPGVHLRPRDIAAGRKVRDQLGWSEDVIACLMVARNPVRKGLLTLLKALEDLPEQVRLIVVGADQDLSHQIGKFSASLRDRVVLQPPVTDVSPYYHAADVFVHPTLNDSFGMSPLEAMAHGLPVVMSSQHYCGFAGYCEDRRHAILLQDPRDAEELAMSIREVVTDSHLHVTLVNQGGELAAGMSWGNVAEQYEALYSAILSDR